MAYCCDTCALAQVLRGEEELHECEGAGVFQCYPACVAYEAAYKLIVLAQTVRVYLFIPGFRI